MAGAMGTMPLQLITGHFEQEPLDHLIVPTVQRDEGRGLVDSSGRDK